MLVKAHFFLQFLTEPKVTFGFSLINIPQVLVMQRLKSSLNLVEGLCRHIHKCSCSLQIFFSSSFLCTLFSKENSVDLCECSL